MTIFERYIGRQVLLSAFFAVLVLTIILVLGKVFKDILTELVKRPDLDAGFVFRFLLLVLPISISISVPWAFLISILLIFGRLSADSELISIRMAGMSMPRICLSTGVIAILFTVLCGWMNLTVAPAAKAEMEGMKNTFINMAKKEPLALFTDGKVMDEISRHLIYASKKDGKLVNFQMVKMNEYFRPEILIIADNVDVTVDITENEASMNFGMHNAYFEMKNGAENAEFAESTPFAARFAPMKIELDKLKESNDRLKPDIIPFFELFKVVGKPGLTSSDRSSIRTEISKRLSFSCACITLGIIGIPLGVTAQRRETSVGFAISLIIVVIYFLLMSIFEMMRENSNAWPFILVWIPNALFLVLGIHQFKKLTKK